MTPFALLLGIGPLVKWRRDQFSEIRTPVVVSVVVMAIAGFALPYSYTINSPLVLCLAP